MKEQTYFNFNWMLLLTARRALQTEIPSLACQLKKVRFVKWYMYSCAHNHQRCKPLGSPGVIATPEKNFRYVPLRCHSACILRSQSMENSGIFNKQWKPRPIGPYHRVHYWAWSYCRLMLGFQKGKNGWETTEKKQRIVLKKTGRTKKTLSFFGQEEFQNPGQY